VTTDTTGSRTASQPGPSTCPHCVDRTSGTGPVHGSPQIALVGAPNVGKSTMFNALTGARRSVGNWPGTTVETGRGRWQVGRGAGAVETTLVDLPGTYSLDPISPDEALTRRLLLEVPPTDRPDVVVVVTDAAHLVRGLYLVAQLREHSMRVVVALTMGDLAARRGLQIALDTLAEDLGVPVVPVDPRRRQGLDDLADEVARVLHSDVPLPRPGAGAADADELELADERFAWGAAAAQRALRHDGRARRSWSDRIDRFALAPVIGPLIFLATMFVVFEATTTVAAPLQDALDALISGPVAAAATALLTAVGLGDTPVHGLVVDGLIAGVGMLLTFLPVMTLMFVLLSLLEDSGYLARAAVVTDRMMRRVGLPGRAFLPLVVGFGCNVPAISATRALPDARHRLLTALLVPFTSCSARLTVYVLLGTTFFPHTAGLVVFTMYVISIVLVVAVGWLLRSVLWRSLAGEPLMIDLPPYQRPTSRVVAAVTWLRVQGFLRTAGGIIVAAVTAVWLLQSIPVHGDGAFADVRPSDSLYAATAEAVAPVFAPAGFDEWQTTGALMVGFVAKEAVVSSWAQTYANDTSTQGTPADLATHLRAAFERSSDGHPVPAVWAFLVFVLAYTPCVATLAAQRREIGLRWTAVGLGVQLAVAWLLAVGVFQLGRLLS